MYAEIYLPISINKTFSYLVPPHIKPLIKVGHLVKVPFGKTTTIGYVEQLVEKKTFSGKIKSIEKITSSIIVNNHDIKKIIDWMSKYYLTEKGIVLKTLLPLLFKNQKANHQKQKSIRITDFGRKKLDKKEINGKKRIQILKYLYTKSDYISIESIKSIAYPYNDSLKTLMRDKYITMIESDKTYDPLHEFKITNKDFNIVLSDKQKEIYNSIACSSNFITHLIHGVTGSGKTAIYLKLVQDVINKGHNVLILVPEITLIPHITKQFKKYFGNIVGIWNSSMTLLEKEWTWNQIHLNKINIIIGTRSSICLPMSNIGLIIVDEEHDSSYKQTEKMPTYNARDLAIIRAKFIDIPIVLGSATPSLESYYNAKNNKYKFHPLMERYGNANYPDIQLIDMLKEKNQYKKSIFSKKLINGIHECLKNKEQIILLHNRRGYATILFCNECNYIFTSKKTSVPLTYHKFNNKLMCHHTDESYNMPRVCPECSSRSLQLKGIGTETIEDEIKNIFSDIKITRFDADTTSKKNKHKKLLEKFEKGDSDILIGTQMVSKGFDFHNVTLVGVINSDIGLFTPDFRSGERIFQLLYQVCGRSGRGKKSGKAIIQTFNINDVYINSATMMNTEKYYNVSLADRLELNYPPFTKIVRILLKGPDSKKVKSAIDQVVNFIKSENFEILGPSAAPIEKINNYYRYHIIIKIHKAYGFQDFYFKNNQLNKFLLNLKGVKYKIDIDPLSLL